jgi:predicted site-specific integrase-resolvase
MKRLLILEEAAQLVQVSTRTILRWAARGLLDSVAIDGDRKAYYLDTDVYQAQRDALARKDARRG